MPGRATPLITDEYYHVYNRGINHQPTFFTKRHYSRAKEALNYYRYSNPKIRLSYYLGYGVDKRNKFAHLLHTSARNITIYAYCFMPNHFHILLKQNVDGGIAKSLSNFQNSYTRYLNTKLKRDGSLFLDQFKAVRIETDEQILHTLRYIHLNPYTSYVVKTFSDLEKYLWSSYLEYLKGYPDLCDIQFIFSRFKSQTKFKRFHEDQADYQRYLGTVRNLMFE